MAFVVCCFRDSEFLRGADEGGDGFHHDDATPTQAHSKGAQGVLFHRGALYYMYMLVHLGLIDIFKYCCTVSNICS